MRATRPHPLRTAAPRAPWGWAALGLAAGALPALLLCAPAHWLAAGIAQASGGRVQLAQARGTVWTGSAQLLVTGGPDSQDRAALPGRMAWRLRPAWSGATLQLQADCCTPVPLGVRVGLSWGGASVALADGQSQWPADVLTGLGTPWNTVQPQGRLALSSTGLMASWAQGRMVLRGQATVDVLGLTSRLSTLRPMGSYRIQLQGGEVPAVTLSTLEGHLQLSGSGQWVGQRLRFAGEASATPQREAQLSNLLNIIGRRNGARSIISVG